MNKVLLLIIIALIIYFLTVFNRGKLEFAKFLLGSVSMFFAIFLTLKDIATPFLAFAVAKTAGAIGELTNTFSSYAEYGMLFIQNKGETISLYIDYECAGFIEMSVFVSLIMFFPIYKSYQKIFVSLLGIGGVFGANIIRLCSICFIVYFFGNDAFYFAHAILGRVIFYALSIYLYYFLFTKSQITNQKIGKFSYVEDTNK